MADYNITQSKEELRESIAELDDLLQDYRQTQEVLDEQRAVLVDQVQGAMAEHEQQVRQFDQRVAQYEQGREELDARQAAFSKQVAEAQENRAALQTLLDHKLGKKPAGVGAPDTTQAAKAKSPKSMASKDQVEKLESQLSKPKPEPKLDPPGAASYTNKVDHDLKQLAKQKRGQLNDSALKMRNEWKNGNGQKP